MAAVAHGWHKPGGGGPPVSVAKDFNRADAAMNKGYSGSTQKFAEGGAVLGRSRDFLKTADEFREGKNSKATDETWGKGMKGDSSAPAAKGKQLPAVKPRS